jgi:hypothetical protein
VMGWPWYLGVAIALPGLMFIAPSMVMAALDSLKQGPHENNNLSPTPKAISSAHSGGKPFTPSKDTQKKPTTLELGEKMKENNTKNQKNITHSDIEILMDYVENVKSNYERLAYFPEAVKSKYLELILQSSGADPEKSFRESITYNLGACVEYGVDLECAITQVETCGSRALEEFFKVFPVLINSMSYNSIASAVCKKFEKVEPEMIIVKGMGTIQKKVYVHQNGHYSLFSPTGEEKYFQKIEQVYEYLGTPAAFRRKR